MQDWSCTILEARCKLTKGKPPRPYYTLYFEDAVARMRGQKAEVRLYACLMATRRRSLGGRLRDFVDFMEVMYACFLEPRLANATGTQS